MSDAEQKLPASMSELLASIEGEWKALMDVVAQLDEVKMTTPDAGGWSPKDNLAHLSEWVNGLMGYHLDRRPAHEVLGVPEAVTQGWDMEVINLVLFERNRNRSIQEVLDELREVYASLLAKLQGMSFDELLQPRQADDPQKRPILIRVLRYTKDHFAEHRAAIEKML